MEQIAGRCASKEQMSRRAPLFLAVIIGASALLTGCLSSARMEEGGRPEAIVHAAQSNRFVGDWGPGPEYVANDWIVRFTKDGRVSVQGPGMTARGIYVASGNLARTTYDSRDGGVQDAAMMHGDFSLSSDSQELTFSTGLANDAPVHLRRIGSAARSR